MDKELDDKLCAKYPKIFSERHMSMRYTCMCWGFCHLNGWYDLIDNLCSLIQGYVDRKEIEQVVACQVKEKFGGLRFYVNGGDEVTDAYIRFAESMSYKICEVCGSPGECENNKGWLSTLCKEHKEKRVHRGLVKEDIE